MNTLKKDLISKFAFMPNVSPLEGNHIILVTSSGFIAGDIVVEDETDVAIATLSKVSSDIAKRYKTEAGISGPLDGNDGFISLKNVSIKSGSSTITLPFLNVFFDQIIGVTIGNI